MKRKISMLLAAVLLLSVLTACGGAEESKAPVSQAPASTAPEKAPESQAPAQEVVKLQLGLEQGLSEPYGKGVVKWAELVEEKSGGSLIIEVYPDSQLGNKNDVIDAILMGETYINNADCAFMADYGVKDLSILFGPFLTDSLEECAKLVDSDWFAEQSKLAEEKGFKIVNATWVTGTRQLLTNKPVATVEDVKGMKLRASTSEAHVKYFESWGANPTPMSLGDVYTALQTGTIEGSDNPLSTLYGRKLHEVSKYLLMSNHLRVINLWVMSADVFNSLSPEHQEILMEAGREAGDYYNQLQTESDSYYLDLMEKEGVITTYPTEEAIQGFKDATLSFYDNGDAFGWTPGLYDTVLEAMGK